MPSLPRQSISIKGLSYQRLKDYCDAQGKTVSGYIEEITAEKLNAAGVPMPNVPVALAEKKKRKAEREREEKAAEEEIQSQHFTF